jgi:hypothetical protein
MPVFYNSLQLSVIQEMLWKFFSLGGEGRGEELGPLLLFNPICLGSASASLAVYAALLEVP